MRDIDVYEKTYLENNDFEKYQVKYRRKRVLQSLYNNKVKGNILEIGCGMEPIFLFYKEFQNYYCVEPGQVFINNARKEAGNDTRITFYQKFLEDCIGELKQYSFDCIICSSLLHEVESPYSLLQAIREVSNNDTVIHLNVPNAKSFHRLLAHKSNLIDSVYEKSDNNILLQQNSVFDMNGLLELIESVGEIRIIDKGSYFPKFFSHGQMQQCLKQNIIGEDILEGIDGMIEYFPELGSEIYIDFLWV